jgi:2-oxoglutarate ferredoxin oxidoreductase subunit delta
MPRVIIDIDTCKGCGLCVDACPKKILTLDQKKINKKGYHPSSCTDMSQCIGCAFCAVMCPDVCITVEK